MGQPQAHTSTSWIGRSAVLFLALPVLVFAAEEPEPVAALDALAVGRDCTAMFYSGHLDVLWNRLTDGAKKAIGSIEDLQAFRDRLGQQQGVETLVLSEDVAESNGLHAYVRRVRYGSSLERFEISWVFDDTGVIQSFSVQPHVVKTNVPPSYETKTDLRLPFDGKWHVFWGGRTIEENYHAIDPSQRYAYDFRILQEGLSHSGEGQANDEYFCWGAPVVVPGDGTVVATVDGIPDNEPGASAPGQELGNHVVIDHGNGEFSFLAHLARGSLKVKKSQAVRAGAPLGSCGNSGNSTEPHLHYHLQASAVLDDGDGLPAQFQHFRANGVDIARGEPTKSQTVQNLPAEASSRRLAE